MIPGVQEIKALALKYSKKQLASMAQTGLIDPQKAVMAGMMRDRIAKEDMQPPSTTVAQDVLGMGPQAQPQMGMQPQMGQPQGQPQPQMPPPQMGAPMGQPPVMAASGGLTDLPVDVQDYAGGGIVAFQEGGRTFDQVGGDVFDTDLVFSGNYNIYDPNRPAVVPVENTSSPVGRKVSNVGRAVTDFLTPSPEVVSRFNAQREIDAKILQKTTELNKLGGTFGLAQQTPEQQKQYEQTKRELQTLYKMRGSVPTATPEAPAPASASQDTPPATTRTLPAPPRRDAAPRAQGPGTSALTAPGLKRPDPASYLPDLTQLKPEEFSTRAAQELPAIGKERTDYLRSMGVDPQMYEKMIEKEEGKRKDLQGRKDVAKGEALMEVGLGLIGARRGQEFQALGEAGRRGLGSLREAGKELRAAEEKLDDRINSFRMADQQFKQTGAEKDLAKRENELNRVEAAKREAVKERNTFMTERARLGMEGAKVRTQGEINLYGMDTQAELDRQKIKIQAQQAANQASYYNKSLAITVDRIKQADAATQARFLKLKQESDKMFEGSQEYRVLQNQLKDQFGDNYLTADKAKTAIEIAKKTFFAQQLEGVGGLVSAARDESYF
jgi:hypothetical protein